MKKTSTLFIDESGKSSLIEKKNQPFILTGAILDNSKISSIEGFFNFIKLKYDIDPDKPFHSYHIFEDPKEKIDQSKAITLSKTLAEYLSLIPIKVETVIIDKNEFKKILGATSDDDFKGMRERIEMREYPYRIMASHLFGWFGKELDKNDSIGQIIADSRKGGDHLLLKTLNLCKEGKDPYLPKYQDAVKKRITAICFAEKGFLSGGLEITDLISYVAFFRARRMISSVSHLGIETIWKQIKQIKSYKGFKKINEGEIRGFFDIKKGEVHKHLK